MEPGQFWKQTPATFAAVMRGRSKAAREDVIILAHQIEAMARQKKLKKLDEYLGTTKGDRGDDAALFAALERAALAGLVTITEGAV